MWGSINGWEDLRIEFGIEVGRQREKRRKGEETEWKMCGSEHFHPDLSFAKIFIRMPCLVKMSYFHGIILCDHRILDLHLPANPKEEYRPDT